MSNFTIKIVAFICLLGAVTIFLNVKYYINAPGNNIQALDIYIAKGDSVKQIGKELAKNNIISYPKLFVLIQKIFFHSYVLKAGEYEIPPKASIRDIIKIIDKGIVVVHKFTIPEGVTTKEILDRVTNESCLIGNVNIEFREGDFISDTYYFTYGETKLALLTRIFNSSQKFLDDAWENREKNLPIKTKQEALVLASIVEKETGIANERPRIAGVFTNRLVKKMKLQADPTVIYAVTLGQYSLNRSLSLADLKLKSPYNTYLYTGLPPTAIAIPGKDAVEAVLHPMKTNELYFVADGKGGHNFSATLTHHNAHVQNYRKNQQTPGAANNAK